MIFIDADACPVRQEAIDIALRHQIRLVMVTNGGVRPYPHALIDMKYVSQGPDEADKWIAEEIDDSDILITSDIPLAAKAIEKQALVIRPDGSKLTQQNIGNILATRDLMSDIRAADPFHQSKSKPFSKADKGAFRQILASLLTQKKS